MGLHKVRVKTIDKYIENAREAWNVPGLSLAIVKRYGEVILSKGYGVIEIGGEYKVDEHTQFAIASNTKAFVSSAISRLVDESEIFWHDRVRDHLPYSLVWGL